MDELEEVSQLMETRLQNKLRSEAKIYDDEVPQQPPLCKDCHWVSVPHSEELIKYKCFAPENYAGINLLNGEKVYRYSCAELRSTHEHTACRVQGIWFKKAEPKSVLTTEVISSGLSLVKSKITLKRLSKEDLDNI